MSFTTLDDFLIRASDRLDPIQGRGRLPEVGDLDFVDEDRMTSIRAAAVLIPVIPRQSGPTALLTQRPDTMREHAGQVAFPGGKIDDGDADIAEDGTIGPLQPLELSCNTKRRSRRHSKKALFDGQDCQTH